MSVGFVDRHDIDGWLGLRQELYSPSKCRGPQRRQSEERGCARCPWAGWYDELGVGMMDRVSHIGEAMGHARLLLWPLGASQNEPWLLAKPLVDLDIGNLLGPRVLDEAIDKMEDVSHDCGWSVFFWTNTSVVRTGLNSNVCVVCSMRRLAWKVRQED